ncbi:MAG: UTP--glucose-1-phosphate uridylyltransferase GalU [Kiritimatiellae bacterium]|nr:UTP--glucose-1-phosphate uridylyltransferase GalU [Kiritimatiellia bacterium]
MKVTKAVIPAAGFGTRFLPATKSQPKEMLPVVDTPVIQYVVEEAVASGITDILMVIGRGKRAIEEHFDRSFELEWELEAKGKMAELETIRRISDLANIHFVWQKQMLGLGDAVRCARAHVNNEPFAVLLGDTLMQARVPATRQLLEVHARYHACVVALEEVAPAKVSSYGVIAGERLDGRVWQVRDLVEKPRPEQAPSRMAVASRYVLVPEIFEALDRVRPGKGGEIQLTDALRLLTHSQAMYGCQVDAVRHDAGNKLDFIKTNILYALTRRDLRAALGDFILEQAEQVRKSRGDA